MSSRYYQRPENAISKAEEFIKVGKPTRALDTLYEVIKSKKRNHTFSEKLLEQIMYKYLDLCVELKKSHVAKEGLFQYRNMCQSTNVASLASVVQGYLNMAEKRTESARQESKDSVADVDDLENLETPEMIMLSAVSGEDAQDRSDRKILMPWVKFLWDSYCQCLELLRTNVRVERLYHDIAQQAFKFCLKYQRKTEFRKLCEKLRNHLELILKQTPSSSTINLNNADTQQMNLDTRLVQLDAAIQMELWQEAYKAVEDIHGLMTMSKKVFQPKMMANYYQKLALVFWKSGNQLFHAAAVFKHFQLTREMKKSITPEELGRMASRVLVAVLAVPLPSQHPEFDKFIETDRTPQEKMARLAILLSLQQPPTRTSLIKDTYRFGIVQAATPQIQDLYQWLEVDFHPLKLCSKIQTSLDYINSSEELSNLQQYVPALIEITLVRLLRQVSQVYQSICFNRLLELAPFTDAFALERIIVECVRHNDMQIRIDHRTKTIHFGTDLAESQCHDMAEGPHLQDMPSEQIRTQLMVMLDVLDKSLKTIYPDKVKIENNSHRQKIVEAYHQSKQRDHQRILQRQKIIEERKEYLEKRAHVLAAEEDAKREQQLREQQELEEKRLQSEREEREHRKKEEEIRQIQLRHIKEKVEQIAQTEIGKKVLDKLDEKEIAELDADQIMARQVVELEKEKRELMSRLKSQEKKVDHMERAKRQVEIPLLQKSFEVDREQDKIFWAKKEADRISQAKAEREISLATRTRLSRMKSDKDSYLSNLLKERHSDFERKLSEFNTLLEVEKKKRLEERKARRKVERRNKWIREKEEEEQRLRDEELKREREEQERIEKEKALKEQEAWQKKKAELDAMEEKRRQREREIEEKMAAKEREETSKKHVDNKKDEVISWRSKDNESADTRDSRDTRENRENREGPWRAPSWRNREDDSKRRGDQPRQKSDDYYRREDDFRRRDDDDKRRDDGGRRDDRRRGDDFGRRDDRRRGDDFGRRDDRRRDDFGRRDEGRRDDFSRRDDGRRDDFSRRDDGRRDDFSRRDDGRRDDFSRRDDGRRDDFSRRDDGRRDDFGRRDDGRRDDFGRRDEIRREDFGTKEDFSRRNDDDKRRDDRRRGGNEGDDRYKSYNRFKQDNRRAGDRRPREDENWRSSNKGSDRSSDRKDDGDDGWTKVKH